MCVSLKRALRKEGRKKENGVHTCSEHRQEKKEKPSVKRTEKHRGRIRGQRDINTLFLSPHLLSEGEGCLKGVEEDK